MATIDLDRVAKYELDGRIRVQRHPEANLFIANYTNRCAYEKLWDDLTLMCRGLIFDVDGNIIARPFKKFFNIGESVEPGQPPPPVPDEPFIATEKIDGSLIIAYCHEGRWDVASRGSFTSDQAQCARHMLYGLYGDTLLDPAFTYLFELVAKHNRIVVNYQEEGLALLTVIHTESGYELPTLPDIGFPKVQQHGPYFSLREFADRYLSSWPSQDDTRQRVLNQARLEDVSGVPSRVSASIDIPQNGSQSEGSGGVPEGVQEGESGRAQCVRSGSVRNHTGIHCSSEECALCGLQAPVPTVRDGLRPPTGGDKAVQHQPQTWQPQSNLYRGRDSEVRCGLCQLSSGEDVQRATSFTVEGEVEEGFVLRYSNGLRLKAKLPEYVRLHKILTGINDRHIWEMLATNQSFDSLLDRVPDEFFRWVEETRDALLSAHAELSWLVRRVYDAIIAELEPLRRQLHDCSLETSMAVKREYRKQFARLASENKYSALLFVLFDGGDPSAAIWQMLRPTEVERPSASAE